MIVGISMNINSQWKETLKEINQLTYSIIVIFLFVVESIAITFKSESAALHIYRDLFLPFPRKSPISSFISFHGNWRGKKKGRAKITKPFHIIGAPMQIS